MGRVAFEQPRSATRLLGRDQGRAEPAKWIEHDLAMFGAILDCVGDQGDRLDGGMHRRVFATACRQEVDPSVVPNISSVPCAATKSKALSLGRGANPEHEYEFM